MKRTSHTLRPWKAENSSPTLAMPPCKRDEHGAVEEAGGTGPRRRRAGHDEEHQHRHRLEEAEAVARHRADLLANRHPPKPAIAAEIMNTDSLSPTMFMPSVAPRPGCSSSR